MSETTDKQAKFRVVKIIPIDIVNGKKMLLFVAPDNQGYSLIKDQCDDEKREEVEATKPGDMIAIEYREAEKLNPRTGKPYLNITKFKLVRDDAPHPESGNGDKMTRADWDAKDRRIGRESLLSTAATALQGSTGLVVHDLISWAKQMEAYVWGEEDE